MMIARYSGPAAIAGPGPGDDGIAYYGVACHGLQF